MQTDYDQLIIGNSGTKLYKISNSMKRAVDINKHMANFVYSRTGFGYGILTNTAKVFKFYNQKGSKVGECLWLLDKSSSLNCQ
jgi:hypothetical protein